MPAPGIVYPSPYIASHRCSRLPFAQEQVQALEEVISKGYRFLKTDPVRAESELRKIVPDKLGCLEWRDQCRVVALLARAIKHQNGLKNYRRAIDVILTFRGGHIDPTNASGNRNLDITLAKLWESTRQYPESEKLQLSMIGRHLNMSEDDLCQLSGNHDADMSRARLWQAMEKYLLAEKLLLAMSRKNPEFLSALAGNNPKISSEHAIGVLCKLSGDTHVDLALARLWQDMKKHKLAEGVLLAITGKSLEMTDAELFKPTSKYDIDLVRQWMRMGKFEEAEKLLLSISGRHSDMNDEELCLPTGKYDVDLVHHWIATGKFALAENLRNACEHSQPVAQAQARG